MSKTTTNCAEDFIDRFSRKKHRCAHCEQVIPKRVHYKQHRTDGRKFHVICFAYRDQDTMAGWDEMLETAI